MSFNIAATSIATGVGFISYGGYKCLAASQRPIDEINQQKKVGLKFVAVGVMAIAIGIGLMNYTTISEENCPISELKSILNAHSNSMTAQTFKVLEENQGLSCANYLPWKTEFHKMGTGYLDGIHPNHLQKPVMWGIDQWKRPYVAVKYVCNLREEGIFEYVKSFFASSVESVMVFFQRYTEAGTLAKAGYEFPMCYSRPLDNLNNESGFLGNLTSFFKGVEIISERLGTITTLNLST